MAQVRYIGERRQTFPSSPAGVLITAEAGKVYETVGGFEYLEKHKDFKVVQEVAPEGGKKEPEAKTDAAKK